MVQCRKYQRRDAKMDEIVQIVQHAGWTIKCSEMFLIFEAPSLEAADRLIETENTVCNLAASAKKFGYIATIIRFPGCGKRPYRIPSSLSEKS